MSTELETLPRFNTVAMVQERTQLSRSTIYRLMAAGQLNALKVGKSLRVSETELRRFMADLEAGALKLS